MKCKDGENANAEIYIVFQGAITLNHFNWDIFLYSKKNSNLKSPSFLDRFLYFGKPFWLLSVLHFFLKKKRTVKLHQS